MTNSTVLAEHDAQKTLTQTFQWDDMPKKQKAFLMLVRHV